MARELSLTGAAIRKGFFFLPPTIKESVELGGKIVVSFSKAYNGADYVNTFRNFIKSNHQDSPRTWMKEFAEQVKTEIVRKYDAGRSSKNIKRTNAFRKKITTGAVGVDNLGNVSVQVGAKIPSFWPILEFGVGAHQREQTFQVVGRLGRGSDFNKTIKSGKKLDSKKRRKAAIDKNRLISTRNRAKGIPEGRFQRAISEAVPSSVRLIPRTKAELARLKRKVTIVFDHPGFPAGEFIRAGQIFLISKGGAFVKQRYIRTLEVILAKSNAQTRSRR